MDELIESFGIIILLTLLPFVLVLMTSFTRISIVLTFLRQALGTSVPSTQVIIGLSLILTGYVMHPVIGEIQKEIKTLDAGTSLAKRGLALHEKAWPLLRTFMLNQTREKDIELLLTLSNHESSQMTPETIPWYCMIPAFVLSELRTAFFLGFLLFLPFLIIDMVVSSLLISMGMVMLPPVMLSFPFKILLFVVVDGWHLLIQQIVVGYQ